MGISIRNILIPTDFSKASNAALKYAIAIAERSGAKLHLLHIVRMPIASPRAATPWVSLEKQLQLQVELAQQKMAQEVPTDSTGHRRISTQAIVGFEVEEIVHYASTHEVDMIVMGTNGRTGLSHFLLGSVAEKVVRLSRCPVMTIRVPEEADNSEPPATENSANAAKD